MYGFRGCEHVVDLMSPFEMWRYWKVEKVLPPSRTNQTTILTKAGKQYLQQCRTQDKNPDWLPGEHYTIRPGEGYVALPLLDVLGSLPHRWYWVQRDVPVVPVWNHAKLPNARNSPEENCRLLSIYFRPWTLDPDATTADNRLLADLANTTKAFPSTATPQSTSPPPKRAKITGKTSPSSTRPSPFSYRLTWSS